MPQSTDRLRQKFMVDGADGIYTCERIIEAAGGSVLKGVIRYSGEDREVEDAIQFLVDEWDYAQVVKQEL